MLCERPSVIDTKKKHFMGGDEAGKEWDISKIRNMYFDLE